MKMILVPAALAAVFALAPLAASARDSGDYTGAVVSEINAATMTVTFTHGATHHFMPAALKEALQPGAQVDFRWQDINGERVITNVTPAG